MLKPTVSVQRFDPQTDTKPRFESHAVEVAERASILDALFALQRGPIPDLAFRFSCRVGMCGSCAMVVNGREQLTCSTLVKSIGPTLKIEPLRNLPVVRDLAVDLAPFFAAYQKTLPHFTPRADLDPKEFYRLPHDRPEWKALNHQPQCIDCAACYSGCTLVTLRPRYTGPMALHRALSLIVDPRDSRREERLQLVSQEDGALRCHTLGNCHDVCPRGISPTQSIERIKRMAILAPFRRWFGRSRPSKPAANAA
ncbi:MAG: succinate dehydrogenase/fumarate reductase iron-sulfur subunit [Opitutaceae bacterium]|nr:succinate dehydrogenase/fumarate reductase iron-sulfur subunit [Opitutaceae bacterium]